MRRLVISVCLAYLFVAFGFIFLTMSNASNEGNLVVLGEADAGMVLAMSAIGVLVAIVLSLRMLVDGQRRRDLEHRVNVPRRKSDIAKSSTLDRAQ